MSEPVDLQDFVGGFVAEAEELIAAANASLLEIETATAAGLTRPRAVRDLFRALHTIKGLAGMIGVEPIVEIAHALESLVRAAELAGGHLRQGAIDLSLQAVQGIAERVRAVSEQRAPAPVPESLLAALASTDASAEQPAEPPPIAEGWDRRLSPGERQQLYLALRGGERVWSLTFVPSEDKAARGISIATVRAALGALGEIIKVAPRSYAVGVGRPSVAFDVLVIAESTTEVLADLAATTPEEIELLAMPDEVQPRAPAPAELEADALREQALAPAIAPLGRSFVRVELARLDALQEQLSALIVSRFRLAREIAAHAEQGHDVRMLREVAELQVRQLRDLRRAILRARMVRVAEVLEPLALLARSLARPGSKELRLQLDAQNAEVDKAVADRLLPAIIHLVRNAIDHGLESLEERRASGKPPVGSLRVACREVGGNLLELEIVDDGRGIDRERIARRTNRAIDSDEELLDVLTTPGFSTRDVATQTSGRGVGMDIVRRIAVGDLGGELRLTTELGRGTTFLLRVPLTIAIIDVFSFECAQQTFVVPVATIEEIFELDHARELLVPTNGPSTGVAVALLERRGHAIPLVSLGALLRLDDGANAQKALVIRRNGEPLAFAIDRILGRQEVVVRPISDPLARAPGIAGATDLGDGRPTLLLDLGELGDRIQQRAPARERASI